MLTDLPGLMVTQGCYNPDTPASPDSNRPDDMACVQLKKGGILAEGLNPNMQSGRHTYGEQHALQAGQLQQLPGFDSLTLMSHSVTTDTLQVGMRHSLTHAHAHTHANVHV